MSKKKLSLYATLFLGYISTTAAQGITDGAAGGGQLPELVTGLVNSFMWGIPILDIQNALVALAFFALFYYLELNFVENVFNHLQANTSKSLSYGDTSDGDFPTGTKPIALVIAYLTSNYFFILLGPGGALVVTAAMGLVSFLMFWTSKGMALAGFFGGGNSSSSSSSGSNSDDTRTDGGQVASQVADAIDSTVGPALNKISDQIASLGEEEGDVEQLLRDIKANTDSLEEMEAHLKELVNSGKLTSREAKELKKIIEEAEDLEQLEMKIDEFIEQVLKEEEEVAEEEGDLGEKEEGLAEDEMTFEQMIAQLRQEFSEINQKLQELEGILQNLRQKEGEMEPEKFQKSLAGVKEDINQVRKEFEDAKQRLQALQELLQKEEQEEEGIQEEVEDIERKEEDIDEKLKEAWGINDKALEELRDEESTAQDIPPEDMPDNVKGFVKEEEEALEGEEDEEETEKEIEQEEVHILERESDAAKTLMKELQSNKQELEERKQEFQNLEEKLEEVEGLYQQFAQEEEETLEAEGHINNVLKDLNQRRKEIESGELIQEIQNSSGNGKVGRAWANRVNEITSLMDKAEQFEAKRAEGGGLTEPEDNAVRRAEELYSQEMEELISELGKVLQSAQNPQGGLRPEQVGPEITELFRQVDEQAIPGEVASDWSSIEQDFLNADFTDFSNRGGYRS